MTDHHHGRVSALSLSLLSIRDGLVHSLATLSDHTIVGDAIDDQLVKFFAKEFTKKTKTALTVAPATDAQDRRAEAKLRLALKHTKRTISASPGAATCSVESLKDGLDFTGTITRLRFDMEVRSVYDRVYAKVQEVVHTAGIDLYDVDEIVYVGGSASLPGLDETFAQGFAETVVQGTDVGGGIGNPTTILSRGAVLQAPILVQLGEATDEEREVKASFTHGHQYTQAKATLKTIGLLFPEETLGEAYAHNENRRRRFDKTVMIVFLATKDIFGYLYSDDEAVVVLVSKVMPLVASFQIADGLAGSCGGVLRGQGRQHLGALFNLVAYYVLALPLGITFAFHSKTHLGLQGLWIGHVVALFIVGFSEYAVVWLGADWEKEVRLSVERN